MICDFKEALIDAMVANGEGHNDIAPILHIEKLLIDEYGTESCCFYTPNFIYFPVCFEGCMAIEFVPRNPIKDNQSKTYLIK